MQIFLFIALIISALAILFAAQNNDPAIVSFIFWEFQSSLAFILIITLAVGALISFLVSLPSNFRVRWSLRNQKKKLNELENALALTKTQVVELTQQLEAQKATALGVPPVELSPAPTQADQIVP